MRIIAWLTFATLYASTGCGNSRPAVGGAQAVYLPPRPPDCELELVTLGLKQGTDVMSPEVRKLVRPRACGYGGTVVSLLATGDSGHYVISGNMVRTVTQTDVVFTVWGPRTQSMPQRF